MIWQMVDHGHQQVGTASKNRTGTSLEARLYVLQLPQESFLHRSGRVALQLIVIARHPDLLRCEVARGDGDHVAALPNEEY